MSETPPGSPPAEPPKSRRWFVILSWVTLIGLALFVGAITVLAMKIPELRRARMGDVEIERRTAR